MLRLADIGLAAPAALLARYGLTLQQVPDGEPIPGSFWGDEEAGIIGSTSTPAATRRCIRCCTRPAT